MYDQLILCGSFSIDRIMSFSGTFKEHIQADKLDIISLSLLMDDLIISHGGIAGNIAYTLALLGEPSTILSAVGSDGKSYTNKLAQMGVDVSQMPMSKKPTSSFTVFTDVQNNQIGGFYPGAMEDNRTLSLAQWKGKKVFIIISAHDPEGMRSQVRQCQSYDIPYMYDISQQVSNVPKADILEGLRGSKIAIVNEYEFEVIVNRTGITPEKLEKISPIFITTLGEKGSRITGSKVKDPSIVQSVVTAKVLDPTGAGDAYRAGLLHGLQLGQDIHRSAMLGSVAASFAIESHGTQNHTFTKKQFMDRYKKTYHQIITK